MRCLYCRYGDRTPLSNAARVIAMVWTLTGVILIGILVGFIAVSLTSVAVGVDYKLYGAKVSFCFLRAILLQIEPKRFENPNWWEADHAMAIYRAS